MLANLQQQNQMQISYYYDQIYSRWGYCSNRFDLIFKFWTIRNSDTFQSFVKSGLSQRRPCIV